MRIAANHVVTVEYTLKNEAGEVLDTSDGGEPLAYIHGAEQIVPGLERELEGLAEGEEKDVVVQPEDGYGIKDPEGVFAVPRSVFPSDMQLSPGDTLLGEDSEGAQLPVRIVEIGLESVTVDANHPLAGQVLFYHVAVRGVRSATAEELEHGHPHGPDGHSDGGHDHGADGGPGGGPDGGNDHHDH
jgi:FKBP-type peptidyl-prolyl cis-trans isomerase SlyD